MNKYNIIYIDPPWTYQDKASAGKRGAFYKYPLLTIDDLKQLPINDITAKDATLFMWVTMPKLNEVFDLITAWGFTYKTNGFTWVKKNKIKKSWFWGMGRYTRGNAELCLLATKGKPKRVSAGVHSIIEAPVGKHSAKPPIVRDKIVELMGDVPRIEIFARETVAGWDALGYDINGVDIRVSLPDLVERLKSET